MTYEGRFLVALALTVVTETIALLIALRLLCRSWSKDLTNGRILAAGFFASFSTLPYLWFVAPAYLRTFFLLVIVGEISVIMIETVLYRFFLNTSWFRGFVLSLAANLISIAVGLIVIPPR